MKLSSKMFGLAAAAAFAILWVLCSLIVLALPNASMTVTGHMVHADLSGWQWDMRLSGIVIGLVAWSVVAGAAAWLTAAIYNRLL